MSDAVYSYHSRRNRSFGSVHSVHFDGQSAGLDPETLGEAGTLAADPGPTCL